jgi:chromate reductase
MRILAISGSLRAASSNKSLLEAATLVAPPGVEVVLFDGLGELPHFNPDLDIDPAPAAVTSWREALRTAGAVLLSSPEYAHGVPGSLKNALDWIVSSGEFMNKPVALVNASSRGEFAQAALAETLTVMMARVTPAVIAVQGRKLDAPGIVADPVFGPALRQALTALVEAAGTSA